jgi:hypothetical protein
LILTSRDAGTCAAFFHSRLVRVRYREQE